MQEQANSDWVVWNDTRELDRRTRTLESIGVYSNAIFDLAGDSNSTPEALYGVRMNANLFPVLGVSPMLGRNVLPEEDQRGHSDVMILSYGLWARRFNSDRSIVGRSVTVNGHPCLVIGVMPPDFDFPLRRQAAHTPSPYMEFWAAPFNVPANPNAALGAVARLRPGVTLTEARQDLASISEALSSRFSGNQPRPYSSIKLRARPDRRNRHQRSAASDGRGGPVHADRMRQRRQPAAGARARPAAGNQREARDRRGTNAHRSPASYRELPAGRCWAVSAAMF